MDISKRKRRIAAINSVNKGGVTYLEYLRAALALLPPEYEVDVYQTTNTDLTNYDTATYLGRPVRDVGYEFFPTMNRHGYDYVIGNDAYVGRMIPDSIKAIFIGHGSAPMPAGTDFVFSEWTAFWDGILMSSKGMMGMFAKGLSDWRKARWSQGLTVPGPFCRGDLRTTSLYPIAPLKLEALFKAADNLDVRPEFTIGILPTAVTAIRESVILYKNVVEIIVMIMESFPGAHILFRPYPADLRNPNYQKLFDALREMRRVTFDESGRSSAQFYQECDVVITDGSTGGVSYMLKRVIPPIYYVPSAALHDKVVSWFMDEIIGKVLIAHSVGGLREKIEECRRLTAEERFGYYSRYCSTDLFTRQDKLHYMRDVFENAENTFKRVDWSGGIADANQFELAK